MLSRPTPSTDDAQCRPAPPLAAHVALLWTRRRITGLPHAREWGLPTGHADLVVVLDGAAPRRFDGLSDLHGRGYAQGLLQGVRHTPWLRSTAQPCTVVGASFTPAGLAGLVAATADHLAGHTVSLDDLWPGFVDALRDDVHRRRCLHDPAGRLACLERALRARLRPDGPDAAMAWAAQQLARGHAVAAVRQRLDLSPARFIERYRQACGLAPKQHARVLRLQAVLQAVPQAEGGAPRWADLAADAGFADQAHLVREFRALAGLTPGQYQQRVTHHPTHVVAD